MSDRNRWPELGRRIKVRRGERGRSQLSLAKAVGISRETMNRIENGSGCQASVLALIARELDVAVGDLLPEEGPPAAA